MTSSLVWTPRRRLIAGLLGLVWLIIGGLFVAALVDTQPTSVTFSTDEGTITLNTDKSLAIAFLQCVDFSWSSENVPLYETSKFINDVQPASGERQACSSANTRFAIEIIPDQPNDVYPQIVWINPAALIFIGLAALALAVLLWQPDWIGARTPAQNHLLFIPLVVILMMLVQVVNPLGIARDLIPPTLIMIPISLLGFGAVYLFRTRPGDLFRLACCLTMIATIVLVAYQVFSTPGMLNDDEKYYASIAATASAGLGLYPYTQNYPPMPIMGGVGALGWLYPLSYQIFGPVIWGPRLVAFLTFLLALPPIFLLFRRWYGSSTAWLAVALIPTTYFYTLSHSVRMDAFTLTWIWWGLLIVDIARKNQTWRWHVAAGLFMGLGLQAHIHTSITTIACGLLYIVDYLGACRRAGRLEWPSAVVLYSIGALLGLGLFVVFNVLPNTDAFLRTAGNAARLTVVTVEKNLSLPERILRSFMAIESFGQNTIRRILYLFQYIPWLDLTLGILAFATLLMRRRSPADTAAITLFFGVCLAGFFILNGPSLYYTLHLFPVAVLCFPSFFTHGYLRRGPFTIAWEQVPVALVLILVTLIFPLYIAFSLISPAPLKYDIITSEFYANEIAYIKANVPTSCRILGPGVIYQLNFMAYPRYNTYTAEGGLALFYYGFKDAEPLWPLLDPDVVYGYFEQPFGESARAYIEKEQYQEIAPHIWIKTQGPLSPGCSVSGVVNPS